MLGAFRLGGCLNWARMAQILPRPPTSHGCPRYGLGGEAQYRGALRSWATFGVMVHLNGALWLTTNS